MLIISAPFGNYLRFAGCIRTFGTYTLARRGGRPLRFWRLLTTVRYNRRQQSWINRMGLPNPGIDALTPSSRGIVSVRGFNRDEWNRLVERDHPAIELNLSCPNADGRPCLLEVEEAVRIALHIKRRVVCKLPPVRWMDWVVPLYTMGVRCFHCCNTIPTPGGGISGKPLMQYSLWAVEEIRAMFPDCRIIGGGGVTTVADVCRFVSAGANDVAVGSMLFNPLAWGRVGLLAAAMKDDGHWEDFS